MHEQKRKNLIVVLIIWLMFIASLIILIVTNVKYSTYIETTAVVMEIKTHSSNRHNCSSTVRYDAVCKYTIDGEEYEGELQLNNATAVSEGYSITVRYNPKDFTQLANKRGNLVLIIATVATGLLALLITIAAAKGELKVTSR